MVLVGHSKGGCDAVSAVARYQKELVPIVAGVVSLQAPLGGTPIATDIQKNGKLRKAFDILVTSIGGTSDSLNDMTYHERRKELESYPFPDAVPLISFSSAVTKGASPLRPLQIYMATHYDNIPNDGMVAGPDADLPGSIRVAFDRELDHSGCAFPSLPWAASKGRLVNEALIETLVQQIPHAVPGLDLPASISSSLPTPSI